MVKKFRRGSAPGPSGLRPEHLRTCLQAAPGRRQRALQSLTSLVNCMAAGGVPRQVAPYLCGARLHGALKKDGGIRPIAVGNLLRRLVGKCCAARVQEKAAALFSPHQLGVGVRNGCEASVHTVREALAADPSLWVLQCDFINAFNQTKQTGSLRCWKWQRLSRKSWPGLTPAMDRPHTCSLATLSFRVSVVFTKETP